MFRNPADRIPLLFILSLSALDLLLYFVVENVWLLIGYFLILVIPKGCICAWNHHHQHTLTFNQMPLNRLLEFFYAFHTGVTTNLWLLHHVLGHHHNYLDQTKDESRWMRADGSTMGVLEYTFSVALTSYYRGYQVGKKYPRHYRQHVIFSLLTASLVAILCYFKPAQGIILFALPMISGLLLTAWATYDHHAGLYEKEDRFKASYNNVNPFFNLVTGNLGYHTAHHLKQGLHWSELPGLHKQIKHRIPENLYFRSIWDLIVASSLFQLLGFGR